METLKSKYKIADVHSHIFPDKIAYKATKTIGEFYGLSMGHNGTCTELIESGKNIGISKYLVFSCATVPEQVRTINDFIQTQCKQYPEFIGLGTVHPFGNKIEEEIEYIKSLGLSGIKLHPDFQHFKIDDEKALPIYKKAGELGLKVLFHTGDSRYDFSSPKRLANAMDKVPNFIAIAAHFGGYDQWEQVIPYLNIENVWFDTSSTLFSMDKDMATQMINILGADRFMFGTDFPMWAHKEELERFLNLPLNEKQREDILGLNFERLFKVVI